MFIYLNQLNGEDPICIDVANVREFYPEIIEVEGKERRGTLVILYRGEPWIVKQSCCDVHQMCQKAKRGGL
ncbi:hypothetical protein EXT67_20745 [Pectobacterium atrosepticum]|uniref:Uncharacterized protein n=1 Tax=Pectobacterium phage phiTE TaxID=1116482 RepID=K9L5J6_9CAUD|nr:hypothetical protein [Pectobacterium atrosepticum]YP_007392498.1 hypothetical protein phiTE_036 [Pectobacterium phage phiTE]ARB11560.1 hypothetical protein CB7_86 [Pectobacterium phage vB_PatM_CB7]MCL6408743.1 hypothetical protein [Dickeya dadantii]AEZ66202.1 hypothetical protein phiTE_036 [Pectobacterium phage phiTE]MCL6318734.1 hypothetical protein [Pectobacterium atrosepticum]